MHGKVYFSCFCGPGLRCLHNLLLRLFVVFAFAVFVIESGHFDVWILEVAEHVVVFAEKLGWFGIDDVYFNFVTGLDSFGVTVIGLLFASKVVVLGGSNLLLREICKFAIGLGRIHLKLIIIKMSESQEMVELRNAQAAFIQ